MKCYAQVYVMNSIEAAKTYCKAFGAEITMEMKNSSGTAYEHCVLSVDGEGILALAEAKNPYDVEVIHKMRWETMTFNAFELGTVDAVKNAFDVLRDGGVVIEEIHEYPWSACGATVIDKYGVCWWISIQREIYYYPYAKERGIIQFDFLTFGMKESALSEKC